MGNSSVIEKVINFKCAGAALWGILSSPPAGAATSSTAVLVVVGGPQYRVGSHRQFVLMARSLAAAGYATLRFDYQGMGDSEGECRTFESCAPDLRSAIDVLCASSPHVRRVVVWGLCDAASAAMMFATSDPRVAGIVAANPWARSEASLAAAQVKYYYASRIMQREFWAKLFGGGLNWRGSIRALAGNVKSARSLKRSTQQQQESKTFQMLMAEGLSKWRGRLLLIMSGNDLTAKEFLQYSASSAAWKGLLGGERVSRVDLAEADHTFSRRAWLREVEDETIAWLKRLDETAAAIAPAAWATSARQNKDHVL